MANKKKKLKKGALIAFPLLILYYIISVKFVYEIYYYNSSQSMFTYVVYGLIFLSSLLVVLFTTSTVKAISKNTSKKYITLFIFLILFGAGQSFATYNITKVSNSIKKITREHDTYETSLIALSDNKYTSVKDVKDKKIGIISNESNIDYIIASEIVKDEKIDEDNLEYYDDYEVMLSDLYKKEIAACFIDSNYASRFDSIEAYENIANEVTEITSKTKKIKKKKSEEAKTLTEPFTVLVLGVDSDEGSLSKASSLNGDTIILITFNPSTSNATILSIPRDTYVPITCNRNYKNKINSAAYGGTDCMINTVEKLTGIDVDYWVKINFNGVISLVNALGGIEVDVPYAFCESDAKRRFGNHTIYIEKGLQTLNGEQALAFARNRHTWPKYCGKKYSNYTSNDFIRGQNQQQIIKACVNKMKNIKSLSKIYDILDVVGDNIDTNISKNTMITGFDTLTKIVNNSKTIKSDDFIGTQRLYLSGYDKMINGIYYYGYYEQSLKEVTNAMKVNLELEEPELIKEFEFSINNPYEDTQIGKGTYKY